MTNEELARNIASQWCRCFKCDGIIRNTGDKCNKDTMITCHQWYHSYRAAKLACEEKDQQFKEYLEKKRDELQEISNKDFYDMSNAFGGYKYVSEIIKELFKKN